jgi:hypothetical protein
MSSLPEKFPLGKQIRYDQEDLDAISADPLGWLWLYKEDPEDTSLAAAIEWEEACAEMELQKAEEIEEIRNWSRKHWAPVFAYDQTREFLDYWIREHARVQAKLQYCPGENAQLQEELQAELEYCASEITWCQEKLQNLNRYAGGDEDEFE